MTPNLYQLWDRYIATSLDRSTCPENRYVPDMPFSVYRDAPGINASTIKPSTPKEMRFNWGKPRKPNYALSLGEALHKAVLEPDKFDMDDGVEEFFMYSPTKGLDSKAALSAWSVDPTVTMVTTDMIDKVRYMRDEIYAHHRASELLNRMGQKELSGFGWDDQVGVVRKIRIDFLPDDSDDLIDIKTTDSISKFKFRASVRKFGYHMSSAWYMDTHELITGIRRTTMNLIAVEGPKGPTQGVHDQPYICRVFELEDDILLEGGQKYVTQLERFMKAAETKQWGAYEREGSVPLSLQD